jgi:hypothetical protein
MTTQELETARAICAECWVARPNEDDEMVGVDCIISLDVDAFRAKMKATLPHIRVAVVHEDINLIGR